MSLINDALKRASQARPPAASDPAKMPPPLHPVETKSGLGLAVWIPILALMLLAGLFTLGGWLVLKAVRRAQPSPQSVAARVPARKAEAPLVKAATPSAASQPAATEASPPDQPSSAKPPQPQAIASAQKSSPTVTSAERAARTAENVSAYLSEAKRVVEKVKKRGNLADIARGSVPPPPQASEQKREVPPSNIEVPAGRPESSSTTKVAGARSVQSTSFPSLKLQGIFYRPSRPSALINRQTVFIGESVDGAEVVAIEPHHVTVRWQGQTKVLTLP